MLAALEVVAFGIHLVLGNMLHLSVNTAKTVSVTCFGCSHRIQLGGNCICRSLDWIAKKH